MKLQVKTVKVKLADGVKLTEGMNVRCTMVLLVDDVLDHDRDGAEAVARWLEIETLET